MVGLQGFDGDPAVTEIGSMEEIYRLIVAIDDGETILKGGLMSLKFAVDGGDYSGSELVSRSE